MQPVGKVYVIVVVPGEAPDTIPLPEPTVATTVLLLLQVPPVVALDKLIIAPTHTIDPPDIGETGYMVTVLIARHPVPKE